MALLGAHLGTGSGVTRAGKTQASEELQLAVGSGAVEAEGEFRRLDGPRGWVLWSGLGARRLGLRCPGLELGKRQTHCDADWPGP